MLDGELVWERHIAGKCSGAGPNVFPVFRQSDEASVYGIVQRDEAWKGRCGPAVLTLKQLKSEIVRLEFGTNTANSERMIRLTPDEMTLAVFSLLAKNPAIPKGPQMTLANSASTAGRCRRDRGQRFTSRDVSVSKRRCMSRPCRPTDCRHRRRRRGAGDFRIVW